MSKGGFVYIMTNRNRTVLYIGVTSDLCGRIYEHKKHIFKNSFTDRYNLEDCIYYEEFALITQAIERETQLKKWSRKKKDDLIASMNPELKVLVTEHGFTRKYIPFSQQVEDVINDLQANGIISPFPDKTN
jgi:putative endonuclease